ncbi:hypothetical protein [Aeromonas schubertii]|nr:hypothetical protein [Aeromonas schubertii]
MTRQHCPPVWLVILLMMFPLVVETIYSPALTSIARHFDERGVFQADALLGLNMIAN